MGNTNLSEARKAKNDEFYTLYEDIEKELIHYKDHFKDKVVYCNCDLVYQSNFFKYFIDNFNNLGLKKLITTNYKHSPITDKRLKPNTAYCSQVTKVDDVDNLENLFNDKDNKLYELKEDGSFASDECIELLKEADVVVTNPPFSVFRDYVATLMEYDKDFLIIMGNQNAITYKEIFPLIKDDKLWLGVETNKTKEFAVSDSYDVELKGRLGADGVKYLKVPAVSWFTNLYISKEKKELKLTKKYNPKDYPKYDNYDAINVNKVADIPYDYDGVMGVPITFLNYYHPEQFEVIKFRKGEDDKDLTYTTNGKQKQPYFRVLIKNKQFKILGSRRWAKDQELIDVYNGTEEECIKDKKTLIDGKETYDRIFIKKKTI